MLGVDRRGAARAGGEEQRVVVLADHQLHREPSRRRRERRLRQVPGRVQLALRLRPDDRIDVRLDDRGRDRCRA